MSHCFTEQHSDFLKPIKQLMIVMTKVVLQSLCLIGSGTLIPSVTVIRRVSAAVDLSRIVQVHAV